MRPVLLIVFLEACSGSAPDACEQLQPTLLPRIEANIGAAAESLPKSGGLGAPYQRSPAERTEREIAHVRSRFVGACRTVGATELTRCLQLAKQREAMPRDQRPAADAACEQLDDAFEAELYRGYDE